ncbi:MAG: hypothetical protein LBR43_03825 [Spiroplasmataceae bacterium]|jgi:hypothetical protein|nr:hypothetical protein [Spiroplasmataceae bacterium]
MKLNEIEIKDQKDSNLIAEIRNLLSNQKTLGEELLEEKKDRLTRLEKELSEAKDAFLNNSNSTSLVKSNNNNRNSYNSSSGNYYCECCGNYFNDCSHHTNNSNNNSKDNEYYLEIAMTCKKFLLEDKCSELADNLFKSAFKKIESLNTKNIFDLVEKIHKCKESINLLEKSIANSTSQEEKLEAKVEVLSK